LLAIGSCGCGAPASDGQAGPVAPSPDRRGYKREARIGRIALRIDARPSEDRAWLVADWTAGTVGENCELVLVLPDSVTVLEGQPRVPLAADQDGGQVRWLLSFPTSETMDATVRLCAQRDDGGPHIVERAIRLVE
jgi:hypothetical protein